MCKYKGPVLWDATVCMLLHVYICMYSVVISCGLMTCSIDNQKCMFVFFHVYNSTCICRCRVSVCVLYANELCICCAQEYMQ